LYFTPGTGLAIVKPLQRLYDGRDRNTESLG